MRRRTEPWALAINFNVIFGWAKLGPLAKYQFDLDGRKHDREFDGGKPCCNLSAART